MIIKQIIHVLCMLSMLFSVPYMLQEDKKPSKTKALLWIACGAYVIGHIADWNSTK